MAWIDAVADIEDLSGGGGRKPLGLKNVSVVSANKRKRDSEEDKEDLNKSWRQALGNPPPKRQVTPIKLIIVIVLK